MVPSPRFARIASAGYGELAADLAWARTLVYYGEGMDAGSSLAYVDPLLEVAGLLRQLPEGVRGGPVDLRIGLLHHLHEDVRRREHHLDGGRREGIGGSAIVTLECLKLLLDHTLYGVAVGIVLGEGDAGQSQHGEENEKDAHVHLLCGRGLYRP